MVCSGKPVKLIRKTIGLLINGNTTEYLTLSKNVKADVIKIFLKIVLILQINFGQPSRNSMLPNYPLTKVWRLRWKDQIQLTKASLPTAFANISEPLPEIWKANQSRFVTLPGANLKKILQIKLRKVSLLLKLRKNQIFLNSQEISKERKHLDRIISLGIV